MDEFDEDVLFELERDEKADDEGDASSEEGPSGSRYSPQRNSHTEGAHEGEGSAKSNTTGMTIGSLKAIAESEELDTVGLAIGPKVVPYASMMSIPSRQMNVPVSLPGNTGTNFGVRMGSSVPIPIGMPMVGKWKKEQGEAEEDDHVSGDSPFIPPHQLSLAQESFMSVAGAASSLRKDRLRARAAILKATGFVEQNMQAAADRNNFGSLTSQGGLSQALQGSLTS